MRDFILFVKLPSDVPVERVAYTIARMSPVRA